MNGNIRHLPIDFTDHHYLKKEWEWTMCLLMWWNMTHRAPIMKYVSQSRWKSLIKHLHYITVYNSITNRKINKMTQWRSQDTNQECKTVYQSIDLASSIKEGWYSRLEEPLEIKWSNVN